MIRNYFIVALRNLWRNKWLSAINITGLAIGIATCLIIMLFVHNELSYDRYNVHANRMYRIFFEGSVQGQRMKEAVVMAPVAKALLADYPEVEAVTRIRDYGTPKMVYEGKALREDQFAFVDSNFFQVFTLPLLRGDAATVVKDPNTAVITKEVAQKYFGKEDPIGKIIAFDDGKNAALTITGLIDKVPENSHFQIGIFASMASLPDSRLANWMSSNYFTYLLLAKNQDARALEKKFPNMVAKYIGPQMKDGTGMTLADFRKQGNDIGFHLQPLTDIHLHSDFSYDFSAPGNIRNVYIFSAIALFMLLIACINFMNLSTAGASRRAREVGIRKVLGSIKGELAKQFLLESMLVTAVAFALAMLLIYFWLPVFNSIAEKNLSFNFADHPLYIPWLLVFIIVTGIIAGSYPAFYLSSFKPASVLKGKFTSGKGSITLRRGLVVFQFFISIFLIVSTAVVYNQLYYMQHKDLGYEKEQVVILSNTWMLGKSQSAFRQAVLNDSRVASVSSSRYLPAGNSDNNNFFVSPGTGDAQLVKTLRYEVDENYIPTLSIRMAAGRNFDAAYGTDSTAVILNEAAVRAMGWKDDPVGHVISRWSKSEEEIYTVIGVVKDFHFRPFHESISPLTMTLAADPGNLIVKLNTGETTAFTAAMQEQWLKLGAEEPLSYSFLDERFYNSYKGEKKIGVIIGLFAGLTILVACLGLFGLAKFTAEQRTKEIGIRKVLGASVAQISTMLSKDFIRLVLLACVLAFPLAWWAMNRWLQDFEYRVNLSWMLFVAAALVAIAIALLTVSFQAIKAAIENPVKSLRNE